MSTDSTTQRSSPQARGERVRRLRNMANLSREAMCANSDFKLDTLIGWEVARHGGLTEKGAQKVITRVAKEGVICTSEWLLHEIGKGPTVVADFTSVKLNPVTQIPKDDNKKIIEELLLFKKHYPDAMEFHITDNSMQPFYEENDFVAGIKCYQDKFHLIIGANCIVQPIHGELIVRKILLGEKNNCYTLVPNNLSQEFLILSNVELIYAAPIIWHRKSNEFLL